MAEVSCPANFAHAILLPCVTPKIQPQIRRFRTGSKNFPIFSAVTTQPPNRSQRPPRNKQPNEVNGEIQINARRLIDAIFVAREIWMGILGRFMMNYLSRPHMSRWKIAMKVRVYPSKLSSMHSGLVIYRLIRSIFFGQAWLYYPVLPSMMPAVECIM